VEADGRGEDLGHSGSDLWSDGGEKGNPSQGRLEGKQEMSIVEARARGGDDEAKK
jgi:hypothetical protein